MVFTSSRISPSASDATYPVRAVGKLYFKIGAAGYMCTGSMIKPGIVVTAGHCVHSGNGAASGWHNSYQFIPGYRKVGSVATAPYGVWSSYQSVATSSAWYSGGGGVPNARDYAVIVFNRNASGLRIGNYTGWLGYGSGGMIGNHITAIGYPGNLDLGGQAHRTDSMATSVGGNNGSWGSDMEGGSSGGPVVLNWRVDYTNSSAAPSQNAGNIVTSVVSWGYVSTAPKVQGASVFDATFMSMVAGRCTAYPWAC